MINIRFISLNDFDLNDNKLISINLNNKIEIKKKRENLISLLNGLK